MSASLNRVDLIGNLGADPVIRRLPGGGVVTTVSLCTNYTRGDVKKEQWHRVVLWNHLAERAEKYWRKGALIWATGWLETKKWTDKDGFERSVTEIIALDTQMLGARTDNSASHAAPPMSAPPARTDDEPDDIPF